MVGFSALILVILPTLVISLTVSLWRFRRIRIKVVVLGLLMVLSVLLMALLRDVPLALSITVFGPGLLIALVRLSATFAKRRSE